MRHDYALLSTAIYLADLMLCDKAVTLTYIFICRNFSIATIPGTCIHRERVWQSHVLGVPPPHIAHSISLSGKQTLCTAQCSLVSRLLCGGGGKRAWYTLFAHVPGSLPLYTKIMVNFCLPAEGRTAYLYSLWDTYERF